MGKIEARTHEYRMVMGDLTSRWCYCRKDEADEMRRNPSIGLAGGVYEVRELYAREAIEAVAEAIKKACQSEVKRAFGLEESFEAIDPAAIISQLIGE